MNPWTAFALGVVIGMFGGALLAAFLLAAMAAGKRADRDLEIATAIQELDGKKASDEGYSPPDPGINSPTRSKFRDGRTEKMAR